MSKKCPPGVFCIENFTLFVLFIILICLIIYVYVSVVIRYQSHKHYKSNNTPPVTLVNTHLLPISSRNDPMNDPYYPPEKSPDIYFPTNSTDIRRIPINIRSRGIPSEYNQIGILTKSQGNNNDNMILPLMGRRASTSNDKWNYYTMASNGHMNTKLPISVKGKSCTNEYGCDEIYNNDIVYVEGYKDTFTATVYENSEFRYIPII